MAKVTVEIGDYEFTVSKAELSDLIESQLREMVEAQVEEMLAKPAVRKIIANQIQAQLDDLDFDLIKMANKHIKDVLTRVLGG